MRILNSIVFCFVSVVLAYAGSAKQVFHSPDNSVGLSVYTVNGQLKYEVTYKGKPVILESSLGIDGWKENMEIERIDSVSVNQDWHPIYGERSVVNDCYKGYTYTLKRKGHGDRLALIVRIYNSGVGFRYKYLHGSYLRITEEFTTFTVPENTYCWFAPFAQAEHKRMLVKDWPGEAERPLTLQLGNGLYASLAEAEMVDYSRTKFVVRKGESNVIRCKMYDAVEDIAPFETPWRVVMVAESPKDLINNNDLILNLNKPCQIEDTSWIKPGRIIRTVSLTTDGAKKVVDFAVKRGLNYIHFDSGWYGSEISKESDPRKSDVDPQRCPVNDLDMPEVVRYAKSKGVGVWVYVNQRALSAYLDEILPLYESWGIAGIKFGFVHVGSFRWTTWLHDAVKKCAKHHLMVDIHDEYRPTGFSRTYPNLLTQEGVRGNEEFPDGVNNTTLPFTRFLCGAADATACHQMALSVINYSPLQFLYWYDTPEDVKDEPELFFFDNLPTTWDDSKTLDGAIGEYITMARRKDNVWYVGCLTNNDARKLNVSLDFLEEGKKYELTMFTDGGEKVKTRTHVAIDTKKVTAKTNLKLSLLPRGGVAMIIKELKD